MTGSVKIELSRPITSINLEITVLELREPTGKDLMAVGNPMKFSADEGGSVGFDAAIMGRMIARLGNITMQAVESMAAADFFRCQAEIAGFLVVQAPTPPT